MCISGGQESTKPSRPLLLLPLSCENAVKAGSTLKPLKLVRLDMELVPLDTAGIEVYKNM